MQEKSIGREKIKNLVLFDVDGTLVEGFYEHAQAFSHGFREVYHVESTVDCIDHRGMTDQEIITEVLKKNALPENKIKAKIDQCMKVMITSFRKSIKESGIKALPGVRELLRELWQKNVMMGLVTGNLEEIAREKLKKLGLNEYFKIGGFGSDDANKANLVRIAIRRATRFYRQQIPNDRVYLVGDARRDINVAKETKIKAIAVATGDYAKEDLKKSNPNYIFLDLTFTDKILASIL